MDKYSFIITRLKEYDYTGLQKNKMYTETNGYCFEIGLIY